MKNKVLLLVVASLLFFSNSFAQGGFQRRTVEERVKAVKEKFADFKLDKDKSDKVDTIFTQFYKAQDKKREEMMANNNGERPDFQKMREEMKPMMDDRDAKLKAVLTEDQYKKWKDEIEPSMRPQRPNNGGGGAN